MERLSRFAIYLGMGIGVTVFVLFLVEVLPHTLENSARDWERLDGGNYSEEETACKACRPPGIQGNV